SLGEEAGTVVPASCDGSGGTPGSHWWGDCTATCPSGSGTYDPYFDPSHTACPSSCTPTNGTIACSAVAGSYGIPSNYTEGTASYRANCDGTYTYLGGCSPPGCATQGQQCLSSPNACGQISGGYINAACVCSVGTPPNPAWYGQACSATSACGTNNGTKDCDGNCSATAPPVYTDAWCQSIGWDSLWSGPNAACIGWCQCNAGRSYVDNVAPIGDGRGGTCQGSCAANQGNACTSAGNSCGMTNAGTIQCDGSCSASIPPDSWCPGPTVTLSASPASITVGGSSTLSWSTGGSATSCWGSGGGWDGWKASGGSSQALSPGATTTYSIQCWNAGGTASGVSSATVTVTAAPPAPTLTLSAAPASVTSGGTSTLTWTTSNASSCWASAGWTGWKAAGGSSEGAVPEATTTYPMECWNSSGVSSGVKSTTVTVTASPTLTICPTAGATINVGNTSSLTAWYNASGPTNCASTGTSTDVTASSVWSSRNSGVASFTGPGTVKGNSASSTNVYATWSGVTSPDVPITVLASCVTGCTGAQSINICVGQTYSATNSCGQAETCNGTRSCNFNWQEIAP